MKRIAARVEQITVAGLALTVLLVFIASVLAANFNVSYTAGQDTIIQNRLIPLVNAANCARYNQITGCTSANLVTGGCVVIPFPAKNTNTCTIYTTDAAGETVFLQDELNQRLVDRFQSLNSTDQAVFFLNCATATVVQKQNACTSVGAPITCNPCP